MSPLGPAEREILVDQALQIVEHLYVHLPLKRSMHAVDPLQRLRLLRHRSPQLTEPAFHAELLSIFTRLRDLHTAYILPEPLRSAVAFLPFRIEDYYRAQDDPEPHYLVSWVKPGYEGPRFRPGAEVTHWNGMPIARAVALNADREAGSNPEARYACGLAAMTLRPLSMSPPPDEEWVVVTYRLGRRTLERRFDWQVFSLRSTAAVSGGPLATATADADVDASSSDSDDRQRLARALGLDARAELERRSRRLLFRPEDVALQRRTELAEEDAADAPAESTHTASAPVDYSIHSKMPGVFKFRKVRTSFGTYGYVRIQTFLVPFPYNHRHFVDEFVRILGLLPRDGLVLDVRGNPGGHIFAAESLLQVLTPRPIEPERFAFIRSPLTQQICRANSWLAEWSESLSEALETGELYSHGFPLLSVAECNDRGQQYQGPVVLVIDARCYSATDIFCAGFQDHEIGPILGTSGATGAGGANVWDHTLLRQLLLPAGMASPFAALPGEASFRVAVRRCTRVGRHNGVLLEDLGVKPDEPLYRRTRDDVLKDNVDLIRHACTRLKARHDRGEVYRLEARVVRPGPPAELAVQTHNLTRLDVYLDGRPDRSLDITDGETPLTIPPPAAGLKSIELRGFDAANRLAASTRVRV
jgi:hypothetical protein